MNREDIDRLIALYATDSLTDAERKFRLARRGVSYVVGLRRKTVVIKQQRRRGGGIECRHTRFPVCADQQDRGGLDRKSVV